MNDGSMAALDYKFAIAGERAHKTHEIQLILYSLLIRDCYKTDVKRGFIAYIRDRLKIIEIVLTSEKEKEVKAIIDAIFSIMESETIPSRTRYRSRCKDCCYRNICV